MSQCITASFDLRINGKGWVRIMGGGWKWFDIIIIGGWNNRGEGVFGELHNSRSLS